MTINDLWHEVDIDHEAVALEQIKRAARKALSPKVSFLMEASTREAFETRLSLIEDDIDRIVREAAGDNGAAYALTRASVVEDFNEMFERGESTRRRVAAAKRARERRNGSVKKAATQAEVDSWLAQQDPLFAEWAKPYAQRMVYGPTYSRSIATNLPDAARAFKQGGFDSKQFRYVRSQLDAALGSERGESWYWDEAQGEYTQRLDGTMAAKKTAIKVLTFDSSGQAYDRVQTDESIKAGDVLVIPSEQVVGIAFSAWPAAVTKARGHLHGFTDPTSPPAGESYDTPEEIAAWAEGWAKAREVATSKGWPLATSGDDYEDEPPSDSHYFGVSKRAHRAIKQATFSSTAPASFVADFEKADQALQAGGWVKRDANGFEYLDPNAPPQLVHLYQSLYQLGYANGYFSGFGTTAAREMPTFPDIPGLTMKTRADGMAMAYQLLPGRWVVVQDNNITVYEGGDDGIGTGVNWATHDGTDEDIRSKVMSLLGLDPNVNYARKSTKTAASIILTPRAGTPYGVVATMPDGYEIDHSLIDLLADNTSYSLDVIREIISDVAKAADTGVGAVEVPINSDSGMENFGSKQAVEIFDRPAGGARADVLWNLAVDNGFSKCWVTTSDIHRYEARVSTTPEGAIANYNGRFFGEFSNVGRAKKAVEEQIIKDFPEVFPREARRMDFLWKSIDGIATTEVGHYALTAVDDRIGAAWAITSKDGEIEYATGKSLTIESAKQAMQKRAEQAMQRRADIFGQDPDVAQGTNPPKKKVKKVVDDQADDEDPDAEDEVEDEDDEDVIEDDAEFPLENAVEDQVETVDPMTLDVGDTLTVSYTMGTGETGEVEGVFVRLEDDIAFFSGPNGEFGVAERDGVWVDSEGNQFSFSFGSPDETGDTDPNADAGNNPAAPAEEPPVADAEDEGDTEYKADDGKKPKKKKSEDDGDDKGKPPWLKGKGSSMTGTLTVQPGGIYTMHPNTGTPITTTSTVGYTITTKAPIKSMAELVTTIGELRPDLGAEEIFELAKQAMAASRERAGE